MKRVLLLLIMCFMTVELSAQNATIYIARTSLIGAMFKFKVNVNDMSVGKLGSKQYFHCEVPAGNVKICAIGEDEDEMILSAVPGGVYYILTEPKMGILKARVSLVRMSDDEGIKALEKCSLIAANSWAANSSTYQNAPTTPAASPTTAAGGSYLARADEVQAHYFSTKQLLANVLSREEELVLSRADKEELNSINLILSKANGNIYEARSNQDSEKQKIEKLNKVDYVLTSLDNRLNQKFGALQQTHYAQNTTQQPVQQQPAYQQPVQQQPVYQQPVQQQPAYQQPVQQPSRNSDVDINIPVTNKKADNTFVLIIANENYSFVDNVSFAHNDGDAFREYCIKTLGVPERQVWLYKDATAGIIAGGVDKMLQAMSIFKDSSVIVYYCGHGIPDESTGDAYIVPTDGKGTNTATCYSLNKLYKTLASANAKNVTYFMDACFSGANRDGSMLVAARGVAREAKKEVIEGNTVVFSAASGDETAMPFTEKQHGLFTYFLLKKLQESKGNVTYGELADYIKINVQKEAFLTNEKPQTPVVATSVASSGTWKTLKF